MPADVPPRAGGVLVQALGLCVLGALLGFAVNAARAVGLPLRTAEFDYQLSCEEKMGDARGNTLAVNDVARLLGTTAVQLVDIRSAEAYAAGHIPGARNIPVSVVTATDPALLRPLLGSRQVVICDDGAELGRAEEFAGELAGAKVGNVRFMAQGYSGWIAAGRDVRTGAQP